MIVSTPELVAQIAVMLGVCGVGFAMLASLAWRLAGDAYEVVKAFLRRLIIRAKRPSEVREQVVEFPRTRRSAAASAEKVAL